MRYYLNGQEITKQRALITVIGGAIHSGYDAEEAREVFSNCHLPGEEGEFARDLLFNYHDGLELFPEEG